jgi:hypothetical protein
LNALFVFQIIHNHNPKETTMDQELDILNAMLAAIGSAGISSTIGRHPGLIKATPVLARANRTLQARGHWFNTDWGLKLTPNSESEFVLPERTLKADTTVKSLPYVRRGRSLYDPRNHTRAITDAEVLVDVVVQLDYSDLPVTALDLIRATAIWQLIQPNADATALQSRKQDVVMATQAFEHERIAQADITLRDNPAYARIIGGLNPMFSRYSVLGG